MMADIFSCQHGATTPDGEDGDSQVANSIESLIQFGMDEDARERLKLEVKTRGVKNENRDSNIAT
jgi:hypothetical protein